MVNKIWNYILIFISALLVVGILYKKFYYDRFIIFDYRLSISQKKEISIRVLDNTFYLNESFGLDIHESERSRSIEKEKVPTKLYLLWFNYNDNKFYEFTGNLPYEIIRKEFIKSRNEIEIKLNEGNGFQLYINDKKIKEYKAIEVSKPWFDKNTEREIAVFFANDNSIFTPEINSNSLSKLVEAEFYNSSTNYARYDSRQSFMSDSLYGNKLILNKQIFTTPAADHVILELKNPNYKNTVEGDESKNNLVLNIELDSKKLFNILKKDSSKKFNLIINLNEKDSLESVILSDQKQNFNLALKTVYDWNYPIIVSDKRHF